MLINQLRKRETPVKSYISLKLYSCIRSKTLLQKLHQIGIWSSYQHIIGIISGWDANALQVYKNSNQFIPLKLRVLALTVFTKDNIDKNRKYKEATKRFRDTSMRVFQTMKSVNEGIARRYSQNHLVGKVSDFFPTLILHKRSTTTKKIQGIFPLLTFRKIYGVNCHLDINFSVS